MMWQVNTNIQLGHVYKDEYTMNMCVFDCTKWVNPNFEIVVCGSFYNILFYSLIKCDKKDDLKKKNANFYEFT